ncbi:MAG: ABC transporter ATP-binding protein [Acidimicrobiales bacterium]
MILVEDLTVERGGRRLLDGVRFAVETGHWLGVLGANGAGKTTLLRCLAGTLGHAGRVELDSTPTTRLSVRQRARLAAVVAQQPVLPTGMAVVDYVLLGRTAHVPIFGVESRRDHEVVRSLLHRLDLDGLAGQRLTTLSGGEAQRAVLARALAQEAPLLLLDEPTSSLDIGQQQRVLALIDELRHERGLTVVSAMHDLTLAAQHGDAFLLLEGGRVAASGDTGAVFRADLLSASFGASLEVVGSGHDTVVTPARSGAGSRPG